MLKKFGLGDRMKVRVLQDGVLLKGKRRSKGFETKMSKGLHLEILKGNKLIEVLE